MVRRSLAAALSAGALLAASGCGTATTPADDVPALATSLDRVDEAIVTEDYEAARDAVAELTDVATDAEEAGDLDADQADRIVAAAEALVAALPQAEPPPADPGPAEPTETAPDDEEETSPAPPERPDEPGEKGKKHKKSKGKKKH